MRMEERGREGKGGRNKERKMKIAYIRFRINEDFR